MKMGKREILLLSALGFIIYAFLGINFVWIDFMNNFKTVSVSYLEVKNQYDTLKAESKNIGVLKNELNGAKLASERINQYLSDKDSVIDAIVYLNKISSLAPAGIREISISAPEIINVGVAKKGATTTSSNNSTKATGSTNVNNNTKPSEKIEASKGTYVNMQIEFKTTMTYPKIKEMINYIEGSAKKVTISDMDIKPIAAKADKKGVIAITDNLDVKVKLSMYSLGVDSSDKYDNYNFNDFSESTGGVLKIDNLKDIQNKTEIIDKSTTETSTNKDGTTKSETKPGITDKKSDSNKSADVSSNNLQNSEIMAYLDGFLFTGENLRIYGFDKLNDYIGVKTNERESLKVNFKGDYYTLALSNESGRSRKVSGSLPIKNDVDFKIQVSFSNSETDKKIGMDITVENESDKKIKVSLDDKQGKIKIMDRSGTRILQNSEKENLSIL